MLRDTKELLGMTIGASDGDIGQVRDLYFDDEAWVIRYLVVHTGTWLSNRSVLVSPISIDVPNWSLNRLPARLTRVQVRNSPEIDTDKPVSRQHEMQYLAYYQYPFYWAGEGLFAPGGYPAPTPLGSSSPGFDADYRKAHMQDSRAAQADQRQDNDPHLRSCTAVTGYHIHAIDGDIGHVQGMLVDEASWAIRYLIVNTSTWWLGHQVLIAPESITEVSWPDRKVVLDLTRQAIQEAPPYDGAPLPDRPGETLVYEHYGHNGAWQYDSLSPLSPRVSPSDARAAPNTGNPSD
jgi:sporulation protein YlmC with PRC-barrel domain